MTRQERFTVKTMTVLDGCHLWTGETYNGGYGKFWNGHRPVAAHRWMWEQTHGPVPDGWQVHHLCGKRSCVNMDHLLAMSFKEHLELHNELRRAVKTHCAHGHEYTEENVYVKIRKSNGRPRRLCRICTRNSQNKWKVLA